jgi:hypothetical protein
VLDASASNIDGFLWRDTRDSSTQVNRPFWSNRDHLILKHLSCRKYSFHKLTLFSQGNNALAAPASNTDCALLRNTFVSST